MNTRIGKKLLSLLLVGCLAASPAPGALAEEDGTADMVEAVETEASPETADTDAEEDVAETKTEETAEPTEDAWEEIEIDAEDEVFTAPVSNNYGATSGKCGTELTWSLDDDGVLTISGTGDMYSYTGVHVYNKTGSTTDDRPWSRTKITAVVIEKGVTSIGKSAFSDCANLSSVSISGSVTAIGSGAFGSCTSLTSITIPDGVTNIDGAFYDCTSLTSITIPNSVTSISDTFSGCTSLTSITLPDSITSIYNSAFYGCTNLMSITIPDSVTFIDSGAFGSCTSLTSITLPDSVTFIGSSVFNECTSLTSITIPDSVTSIGNSAFYGCSSLTNITIPDSVTSIGDWAFYGCSSLTNIAIPDSVTSIGNSAFYGCSSLINITFPDEIAFIGYWAFKNTAYYDESENWLEGKALYIGHWLIEAHVSGNYIVESGTIGIAGYAFSERTGLTGATLPDSVTYIGDSAFYKCKKLTDITIPSGVTCINYNAFYQCTSLTSIVIPNYVTSIGVSAFQGCTSLKSIVIPKSTTSIGTYAFLDCTRLTSVYYGGSEDDWKAIEIGDDNKCLTGATKYYGFSSSLSAISIARYDADTGAYTHDYDALLAGDSVIFSVEVTVNAGTELTFSASNWESGGTTFGSLSVLGPYTVGDDETKQVYSVSIPATLGDAGTYTVTFFSPTGSSVNAEFTVSGVDIAFGASHYTNLRYAMPDDKIDLYGLIGSEDEDFDVSAAIEAVTWTVSDSDVAEITAFAATGNKDLSDSDKYIWKLTVHTLRPGEVTFTGTSASGSTTQYTIGVEPELSSIETPETIYRYAAEPQEIICTLTLDKPDRAFLEAWISDNGGAPISFELESKYLTTPGADFERYEISDDGSSVVYTLAVNAEKFNVSNGSSSGTITAGTTVSFTTVGGQTKAAEATVESTYMPVLDAWNMENDGVDTLSEDAWHRVFSSKSWGAELMYKCKIGSAAGGLCHGYAIASAMTFLGKPQITTWTSVSTASEVDESSKDNESSMYRMTLQEYIEALFITQFSYMAALEREEEHMNEYEALIHAVNSFYTTQKAPIAICISGRFGESESRHTLLGYRTEQLEDEIRVYVYDCNYSAADYQDDYQDDERYISFSLDADGSVSGWSYTLWRGLTWGSGRDYSSISYWSSLSTMNDVVLSDSVLEPGDFRLLDFTSSNFQITTADGNVITYSDGHISGDTVSGIVPILDSGILLNGSTAATSDMMFYVQSGKSLTVQNRDDSGENVATTLADNDSDVTIVSDGQSTVTLGETDELFQVSVTPSASGSAAITYTTDFGDTVFEVSGTTDGTVSLSAESGSAEIRFSGYEAATVTVTRDGSTTTLDLGADTYTVAIQDDGTVIAESATTPGDLNGDGEVNASDLTILARHVGKVEYITDKIALANADVTGDGNVDASDLTKLAQYVGKIISSLD